MKPWSPLGEIWATCSSSWPQWRCGSRMAVEAKPERRGNNAAWTCRCNVALPLLGRCYFQFGHSCFTVCPACSRMYRVKPDSKKRAKAVEEQ